MSRRKLVALLGAFALLTGAVLPPATAQAAPASPAAQAQAVTPRYGPYTIPKAANGEHGELPDQIAVDVAKPCENCFVTGFKPNLAYADGSNANINTGPMLHHAVIFNSAAPSRS